MRGIVGVSIAALALGGCAGLDWETERADPKFVDGTRVLAQVAHIYADRNEILTGNTDRFAKRWHEKILTRPLAS
jgi:hypothetical protein